MAIDLCMFLLLYYRVNFRMTLTNYINKTNMIQICTSTIRTECMRIKQITLFKRDQQQTRVKTN